MSAFSNALPQRTIDRHSMQFDLLKIFGISVALELFGRLMPSGLIRAIFVLPPLILVPGFALITLAFGKRRPTDPVPLVIFSVATSFAVMAFNMLIMNAFGIRFSLLSLSLGELITTDVLVAGVMFRAPTNVREKHKTTALRPVHSPSLFIRLSAISASIVVSVAIVAVVAHHEPVPTSSPFTSLSTSAQLASKAKPLAVTAGEALSIPLTAATDNAAARKYSIVASIDGQQVNTREITVPANGTWSGNIAVVVPDGNALHRLVIDLDSKGKSTGDNLVMYLNENAS